MFGKTLSQWKYAIYYHTVIDISGEICLDLFKIRVNKSLSGHEKFEFKVFGQSLIIVQWIMFFDIL